MTNLDKRNAICENQGVHSTTANPEKSGDAKLKGLNGIPHGSQLPKA